MKILIADNHTFFREGFRMQLESFGHIGEIREATNFKELKELAASKKFNIIFIDRDLLETPWSRSFQKIVAAARNARIVLMIESETIGDIWQAFELGAQSCLTKYSADSQNINVLRLIIDGVPYVPPAVLNNVSHSKKSVFPSGRKLTFRQRQVLDLLSIGLTNKEIAFRIDVTEATVKLHINSLLRNLHVENRTKAVITAQKMGLL